MTSEGPYNRLKDEKSLYLKQHQHNPVDWWPWGPEPIQKARDENKPIFLSVGYSSCHWCHVMAHDTFENKEVADYLNEHFVSIKVDREEYPDVDSYYQDACRVISKTGGWPLSVFLMPDTRPFFAGTYFPPHSAKGMTGFLDVMKELTKAWKENPSQIEENATKITAAVAEGQIPKGKVEFQGHFPPPMAILDAVKKYADEENGGYGQAPKFPQFAYFEWAVEQMLEGMVEKELGGHIVKTLENMLMGGINDHVRGGLHRYSVDASWTVPHFEKMLYDQAGALRTLAKFGLLYPSPLVFDTLMNTLDWLENEMLGENKCFFSAQSADSEGVEGLYFCFTKEEFEDAVNSLDDEELTGSMDQLLKWFNISEKGNFERGLNVISLSKEHKNEIFTTEAWEKIRKVRKALLKERKERIPPATDNKHIASWNFMMVSALADVMQYCQIDTIKQAASRLFNQVLEGIYQNFLVSRGSEGVQLRHTTTKENTLPYFEDYVTFAEAQLRTYEVSGNEVFKQNFLDTLNFIKKEFIKDGKVYTRAISTSEHELYPNQEYVPFDFSFRSPLATLVLLLRRGAVLSANPELFSSEEKVVEEFTHAILKNPLQAGQGLRAMTYPQQAFRTLKVPKQWLQEGQFVSFIAYFLPRFVLDYHNEGDGWQICGDKQCELQGEGLEEFIKTLTPERKEKAKEEK